MTDNRPNTSKRRHNTTKGGSLSIRRPSEASGIKKRRKSSGSKDQQQPSKLPTETKLATNRGRQPNKLPVFEPPNQSAKSSSRPTSVPATQKSSTRALESNQIQIADPELSSAIKQPELKAAKPTKTSPTGRKRSIVAGRNHREPLHNGKRSTPRTTPLTKPLEEAPIEPSADPSQKPEDQGKDPPPIELPPGVKTSEVETNALNKSSVKSNAFPSARNSLTRMKNCKKQPCVPAEGKFAANLSTDQLIPNKIKIAKNRTRAPTRICKAQNPATSSNEKEVINPEPRTPEPQRPDNDYPYKTPKNRNAVLDAPWAGTDNMDTVTIYSSKNEPMMDQTSLERPATSQSERFSAPLRRAFVRTRYALRGAHCDPSELILNGTTPKRPVSKQPGRKQSPNSNSSMMKQNTTQAVDNGSQFTSAENPHLLVQANGGKPAVSPVATRGRRTQNRGSTRRSRSTPLSIVGGQQLSSLAPYSTPKRPTDKTGNRKTAVDNSNFTAPKSRTDKKSATYTPKSRRGATVTPQSARHRKKKSDVACATNISQTEGMLSRSVPRSASARTAKHACQGTSQGHVQLADIDRPHKHQSDYLLGDQPNFASGNYIENNDGRREEGTVAEQIRDSNVAGLICTDTAVERTIDVERTSTADDSIEFFKPPGNFAGAQQSNITRGDPVSTSHVSKHLLSDDAVHETLAMMEWDLGQLEIEDSKEICEIESPDLKSVAYMDSGSNMGPVLKGMRDMALELRQSLRTVECNIGQLESQHILARWEELGFSLDNIPSGAGNSRGMSTRSARLLQRLSGLGLGSSSRQDLDAFVDEPNYLEPLEDRCRAILHGFYGGSLPCSRVRGTSIIQPESSNLVLRSEDLGELSGLLSEQLNLPIVSIQDCLFSMSSLTSKPAALIVDVKKKPGDFTPPTLGRGT